MADKSSDRVRAAAAPPPQPEDDDQSGSRIPGVPGSQHGDLRVNRNEPVSIATEPKEPDVVPLDDPSVPYSLVPLGDGTDGVREALEWALRQIAMFVSDSGDGVFIRGTSTELAGFGAALDKAKRAAAPAPQPQQHALDVLRHGEDYVVVQRKELASWGAVPASPWPKTWTREEVQAILRGVRDDLTSRATELDYDCGVCDACNNAIVQFNLPDPPAPHQDEK